VDNKKALPFALQPPFLQRKAQKKTLTAAMNVKLKEANEKLLVECHARKLKEDTFYAFIGGDSLNSEDTAEFKQAMS